MGCGRYSKDALPITDQPRARDLSTDSLHPGALAQKDEVGVKKMNQDLVLGYLNDGNVSEALRLSCWDYGGQDTFYGLHNLYIGRKSVYVIVFSMLWFLVDVDMSERDSHLKFLVFWLNTIAAHAVDPEDGSVAPIVLVGTHKDAVASDEQHQYISKLLSDTFSHSSVWKYVHQFKSKSLAFFPIDNTMGSKDPVMLQVKQVVYEAVMAEKYIKEKVPFTWLKVRTPLSLSLSFSIFFLSHFQRL